MERQRWTLLAIDEAAPSGLSPVQLQKTLFLIGKNLTREVGDSYYSFVPYNYGPFDAHVYSDAEVLIKQGLVFETRSAGRSWSYYRSRKAGIGWLSRSGKQGKLVKEVLDMFGKLLSGFRV